MKTLLVKRDRSIYYHFHRDYDHNTEDYHNLKKHIEEFIYVRDTSSDSSESTRNLHLDLKGR